MYFVFSIKKNNIKCCAWHTVTFHRNRGSIFQITHLVDKTSWPRFLKSLFPAPLLFTDCIPPLLFRTTCRKLRSGDSLVFPTYNLSNFKTETDFKPCVDRKQITEKLNVLACHFHSEIRQFLPKLLRDFFFFFFFFFLPATRWHKQILLSLFNLRFRKWQGWHNFWVFSEWHISLKSCHFRFHFAPKFSLRCPNLGAHLALK